MRIMGSMLMQVVKQNTRSQREMEALRELEEAAHAADAHGAQREHSRRVQLALRALLDTIEEELS